MARIRGVRHREWSVDYNTDAWSPGPGFLLYGPVTVTVTMTVTPAELRNLRSRYGGDANRCISERFADDGFLATAWFCMRITPDEAQAVMDAVRHQGDPLGALLNHAWLTAVPWKPEGN